MTRQPLAQATGHVTTQVGSGRRSAGDIEGLAALDVEQLATLEARNDRLVARLARHERLRVGERLVWLYSSEER